ncbi:MAG: SurA N-terminal domain-containing protein [Burkholderiales bacterium]|nr:SurA N-terminal domain-containing protein [Burkholderiales bacterium]
MLETIRTATKTWVAKVILALITIPFALWGVESYIRTPSGQDTVSTVEKEKITTQEFQQAVRNQLDQFRQQFGGSIDASVMDNPEMRKSILDQLIDQRLVVEATKSSGLVVSDATLRERISTEPTFQQDGKFAATRYELFLKAQGLSAVGFESRMRQDLERQRFVESISSTAFTSNASVKQYMRASEQKREIAIVNIAPEQFTSQVKLTADSAKAYYEQKKADYTTPEQVRAEYIELSVDALTPTIQIPVEEIKAYYDANSGRYIQKEQRKASHILINVTPKATEVEKKAAKDKADTLFAQARKNPKDFAELAKKNSQDTGSAVNGGDLGLFARGMMVKPFEDAAFGAKKDDLVGPVLSDFGYHIIRVTDIQPEKGKSLAEVTPEIEGELKKQRAARKFAELAEKFTNAAYEQSSSLKAASDAVGVPTKQSAWMAKGQGMAPPFGNQKLQTALFSDDVQKNKRNTEAVEVATNTLVVARLLESKPAVVKPFAEVEAGIIARLTREEASKLALKSGEAKLAALKDGKAADLTWPQLLSVSRASPGGLGPNVIEAAMKADPKSLPAYVGTENPGGGFVLVKVAKVIDAPVVDEAKLQTTRTRIAQAQTQQEILSTLAQIRAKSKVSIASDALTKKQEQ